MKFIVFSRRESFLEGKKYFHLTKEGKYCIM